MSAASSGIASRTVSSGDRRGLRAEHDAARTEIRFELIHRRFEAPQPRPVDRRRHAGRAAQGPRRQLRPAVGQPIEERTIAGGRAFAQASDAVGRGVERAALAPERGGQREPGRVCISR